ncbi:hypothetical protein AB1Y20_004592 [Prymnesium parvum]|uniref:Uncharacterized protein n=1 Tax=Prymnesium parvum TaxID=97485 RepID=A0AB34IZ80_PRYPA
MAASPSAHFELPLGGTATQVEGEPMAQVETEEEDDAISFPLLHADSSPSDSEDDESEKAYHIEIEGLEPLGEGDEPEQRRGVSKLGIGKKSWTAAEDDILAEIVAKNGAQRWSTVASHLPGRAGKQCRERWFNHLCPEVKKGSWTEEEDRVIMESVQRYGTKWSAIVKLMPGRTDNAIKNRYNSAMRRYKRLQRLQEAAERGEGEMPKMRARSTSGSVSLALKKRKRDLGESEETDTGSEAVVVSRPKVQAKEDASLADIKIDLAPATSHTMPPLTELDLDGVLNNGISPNSASAFLSQISPTQLGQPHMFDSSARASGDGAALLLDDSGSGSGAKSSPFDFSSALQAARCSHS